MQLDNLRKALEDSSRQTSLNTIIKEYFSLIEADWTISPTTAVRLANRAIENSSQVQPELLVYIFLHAAYVSGQHQFIFDYCRQYRTNPSELARSISQFIMYSHEDSFIQDVLRQESRPIDKPSFTSGITTPTSMIVTACDDIYYKKYLETSLSNIFVPSNTVFHIGLIDATATTISGLRLLTEKLEWLSYSVHSSSEYHELVDHPHISSVEQRLTLYACHRFFIAKLLSNKYNVPLLICDTDTDFESCDISSAIDSVRSSVADVGISRWANDSSPGLSYTADLMVFYPTINSMRFLSLVCRYLLFHIQSNLSFWTLDQVALNAIDRYMARTVSNYVFLDLSTHPLKQRKLFCHKGSTEFRQQIARHNNPRLR